jgi:uncharacterized protein YqgQ
MAQIELNNMYQDALINHITQNSNENSAYDVSELYKNFEMAYEELNSIEKEVLKIAKTILKKKKIQINHKH